MGKITPTWVGNFETNLSALIDDEANRQVKNLVWDQFMDLRKGESLRELIFFLINTQKLTNEGQGGNKRMDDILAYNFEFSHSDFGAGLKLRKNEIEDNVMVGSGMPMMNYSAQWAINMGALGARHPEDTFVSLLSAGTSTPGYDGVNFFSASHPVNPYLTGGPTFQNHLTGAASGAFPGACPIDGSDLAVAETNFAKAVAFIESLTGPNGKPRNLKVAKALGGPLKKKSLLKVLDTKFLSTGSIENVVSRYGIEPVIATSLGADLSYYLFCEWSPGSGGPFIYSNREDFHLSSYAFDSSVTLARMKEFEWHYDGRNAGTYGHPYLVFKVSET